MQCLLARTGRTGHHYHMWPHLLYPSFECAPYVFCVYSSIQGNVLVVDEVEFTIFGNQGSIPAEVTLNPICQCLGGKSYPLLYWW